MPLDERIVKELRQIHQDMTSEGRLPPRRTLDGYYAIFRSRFGPEQLAGLDGLRLLETLHKRNKDSMVYWLEFKNDEEFTEFFGSIAGGSALKFSIFQDATTFEWKKADPSNYPVVISEEEAIEIARRQRDQIIKAVELLETLPTNGTDVDYQVLQEKLNERAPDVVNMSWGHKYLSLIFPTKVSTYHNASYQRLHLVKLLQLPPEGEGRFITDGRYAQMANELDMPPVHFHLILNRRHPRLHKYWRVIGNYSNPQYRWWDEMRDGGFVGIGWKELGDLATLVSRTGTKLNKDRLRELMRDKYNNTGRSVTEVYHFIQNIQEGDVVVAFQVNKALGVGRVTGGYGYSPSSDSPIAHRRPVKWLSSKEWTFPHEEGVGAVVKEISDYYNLVEIERVLLDTQQGELPAPALRPVSRPPVLEQTPVKPAPVGRYVRLEGMPGEIQAVLERKNQVIVYGPPGTGKTYWSERTACDICAYHQFGVAFEELSEGQQRDIVGNTVQLCSFHPAYGYEDFIEGYRPRAIHDQMTFELQQGIFKRLCYTAQQSPDLNFYLIIDEINRGDIPRIFGELITLLEKDKRGKTVVLPLSGEAFFVPSNVYLIGTMNTADRSIALLDAALRRRFGFVELMPDISTLKEAVIEGIPVAGWLQTINSRILEFVGHDARNLQIGHAYLLEKGQPIQEFARFVRIVREDIIPLLEEYCYEDYAALEKILGSSLVDVRSQKVRHELFQDGNQERLIQALKAVNPDLVTSIQAVVSDVAQEIADAETDEGEA